LLTWEARGVLRLKKPFIVGITGSVGKTSAKEAIATVLGEHFTVRKSPKSFNSEIGIPLTILGLENAWNSPRLWAENLVRGFIRIFSRDPYPEILVLEMGVDRPGDMDRLLAFVRPDVAVVTAIGKTPVHVEFFAGPEAVAHEKAKLVRALAKDGVAILNADDKMTFDMRKLTDARLISYGFSKEADIRASQFKHMVKAHVARGITFKIDVEGKTMPIRVEGVIGEQVVFALLAAAGVGIAHKLNLVEIGEALTKYKPQPGRLNVIAGKNETLIIDDSYNSSPMAAEAALKVLESINSPRKIAVLGDMLELGKFTSEEHRRVGAIAAQVADVVVAVGVRAKFMENGKHKNFHWFADSRAAADFLASFVQAHDVILVKGSQGMRMERIVEALMAEPERAKELLVRQEQYWKKS
ncbi:MAG: UDP-N-acetylmuramoyl-tripeptide--D-alanyl-D-alanine ligase, partial [Candidatus Ryanbacteria bacterium]|nr:UDP-N-acetylmuramoyl-tripeptide--D-alanyl-D-alanine ligase [Candidatus Ryanbacteria bacterium]